MIVRTVKDKQNPYYLKNRAAPRDRRLSWKAKGIHDYLMSQPDDWVATVADLVEASPDGEHAVRAAITELIKYGYMRRVLVRRRDGRAKEWRLDTYEIPYQPDGDFPGVEKRDLGPDRAFPDVENHHLAASVQPDRGFPDVEKRDRNKYMDGMNTDGGGKNSGGSTTTTIVDPTRGGGGFPALALALQQQHFPEWNNFHRFLAGLDGGQQWALLTWLWVKRLLAWEYSGEGDYAAYLCEKEDIERAYGKLLAGARSELAVIRQHALAKNPAPLSAYDAGELREEVISYGKEGT